MTEYKDEYDSMGQVIACVYGDGFQQVIIE